GPYGEKDNAVDLLTTAHFGHIALYFGDLEKAKKAGDFLCDTLSQQPDKEKIFLRFNNAGEIIQDFAHESDFLFVIDSKKPQRAYFMIGYPAAFLGLLYRATQSSKYLHAAKAYLDFALKCQPNLYHFHFSHKVAWAAAIVYSLTHDKPYLELSQKITNYLINTQNKDGTWLSDEPIFIKMDQTAETAIWLKEISNELRRILK
ncbi:MAG: hypothetical protein JSS53_04715, partial [Proteobacteria bacterium]|nr:hypothetical protein [Pseudomonadota bacterium]